MIAGLAAFMVSLRLVDASIAEGLKALVPSTIASAVMAAAVWSTHLWMQSIVPLGARVAMMAPLGLVLYLVALRLVSAAAFRDLISTAGMMSPKLKRLLRRFTAPAPVAGGS